MSAAVAGASRSPAGFTLLELIIVITLVAVFGAVLAEFGSVVRQSSQPLGNVQDTMALRQVLENITGDYNSGTNLATLFTRINTPAGAAAKNNAYGSYTLTDLRFVKFDGANTMVDISAGDPQDALFVEIAHAQGQRLSTIFFE